MPVKGFQPPVDGLQLFGYFALLPEHTRHFFRQAVHIHDLILLQEIQHFCRCFQIVDSGITARFSRLLPPRKDTLYHLCKSGRLGVRRFLFQPALQLGNAGFQLPQLLICDFDFAVDVSPLRADSALLHLKGGYAQMHGGDQVYSLPLIAAVVYALGMISLFKIRIADFSPRRPPFLRFGLLVPVGGGNGFALFQPRRHHALPGRMTAVLERIAGDERKHSPIRSGQRPVRSAFKYGYVGNDVGIDRSVCHCHLDAVANLRILQRLEVIAVAVSIDGARSLRPRQSRGR